MTPNQRIWARARDELAAAVSALGYPAELADLLAKQLGSPKAIDRMTAYLRRARPGSLEMIIDEMLAIRAEIDAWHEKKKAWMPRQDTARGSGAGKGSGMRRIRGKPSTGAGP